MRTIAIVVFLLAASAGAPAQQVWRCGNSYGTQPCEGGTRLGAAAPVNAREIAQARAVGQGDAKLAADLEKARLDREKQAPRAVIPPAPAPVASASARQPEKKPAGKKQPADRTRPDHLTAVGPQKKK